MDSGCGRCGMLALLLLPLLWAGEWAEGERVGRGYELKVAESVTVQEGLCILVHCHFSYPWPRRNYYTSSPPYIYWFLDGDTIYDEPVATNNQNREVKTETRDRFHLVQDIRNNNCSLHITDARKGDSGHYVFRVERGSDVKYTYRDKKLTLRVTGPKMLQNTSLLTIQEGHALQLQCVVDSNPPAKLSWFRGSSTLNSSISNSGILKLSPSRIEDEGKITCHAQNALGNQTVSLNLSVLCEWKSVSRPGSLQVLSALGGAGTMALLCLCMCLIFICIPASCMRKSSLCTQNGYRVNIRLQELTLCLTLYSCYDSFFPLQGSRQESWPDSQGDQASSTGDALPLGEQQDLHYASLSFHGIKPQELQDMKATSTTEYSEIKINK
uniref:Ig-like domain-containing protein n=1 Tax=Castor canadensis TaxID=51338 RepID=A0A8C0WZE1_CASCN